MTAIDRAAYEVGKLIRFRRTGGVYRITAVDTKARTVTFVPPFDAEDVTTETFDDLAAVDVQVLP